MTKRGADLLLGERDALLPLLAGRPDSDFDRPTVLPGWSVRDVLAHCASALSRTVAGTGHGFSPVENQADVDERKAWPVEDVIKELSNAYADAAALMLVPGSRLDGLALGEWLHGGDVREALGIEDAYRSAGIDDALDMVVAYSRRDGSTMPTTRVVLSDRDPLVLGADPVAELVTDTATFVRIWGGRSPDSSRYSLTGAKVEDYVIFD